MIIDSTTPSYYAGSAAASAKAASSSASAGNVGGIPYDTVEISDAARYLSNLARSSSSESTRSKPQAAGQNLRKYINTGLGYGQTNLTAMNFSRKNLGSRIDGLIKSAGIKLDPSEKLAISVDKDDSIVVAGIKDKDKAKAIQDALNADTRLAREMKSHVASARVTESAQKQEEYAQYLQKAGLNADELHPEGLDELFTSDSIRSWVVDSYISEETGQQLDQLSIGVGDDGSQALVGAGESLQKLFANDPMLEGTILGLLDRGQTQSDFQVSFEFQNGAISDPHTLEMAKAKIDGVKEKLMGGWDSNSQTMVEGIVDKVRKELELIGGDYEKEFMDALGAGFSIRVDKGGSYEIVGADTMSAKMRDVLDNLVQQALDQWANEGGDAMDAGGVRVANFADVADAFIEQHRFEHGDVDQHKHMLEINFSAGPGDSKVVSPEADKAQDEKNKETSKELGAALRDMLGENGVDAAGLEFEMDDDGNITVLGDPANADIAKAQSILDQFCATTRANAKVAEQSAEAKDADESKGVGEERRAVLLGTAKEGDDDHVPEGFAQRDVVANSDKAHRDAENRALAKKVNNGDALAAWERTFPKNRKVETHFLGSVSGGVSAIRPLAYNAQNAVAALAFPNAGATFSTAGSTATQKYIELLNGMGSFHDERSVSYRF